MKIVKDKRFWLCLGTIFIIGLLSGIFALDARTYYANLQLPAFAPPGWLFGPVWILLYLLIGIAFYFLADYKPSKEKNIMMTIFVIQYALNFIWSIFFFTFQQTLFSVIDITILWLLLLMLQIYFFKYIRVSMWLMLPYFLWVSFAMILNYAILFLN